MRKLGFVLPLAAFVLLFPVACKRGAASRATTPTTTPTPTPDEVVYEGSSRSTGVVHAGDEASRTPEATPTPLAVDGARLQKYIGFRKEMNVFMTVERKKMNAALKKESAAQIKALTEITAETEKGTADLRAKHGLTEAQDKELGDAITDVLGAAMTRGEMLAPTIQEFKAAIAKGGEGSEAPKAMLKQFEDQEKKNLEKVRRQYGSAAVDLLLAHFDELQKLQMDSMKAALGGE